jgi:hypothetical protein
MTTFAKNLQPEAKVFSTINTSISRPVIKRLSSYDRLIESLNFSHFGLIAMSILVSSCLGSVATIKIFENGAPVWQFIISLGFTMANLVACISQAPTKWVVNLFGASLLVNTILLLLNLF